MDLVPDDAPEFPENGSKKEQIKWFAEYGEVKGAGAISFVVGASKSYTRKVLNSDN